MKRLAVIGHPVAHSRSPAMHNAALAELGLADEWCYEAIDVAPEEFEKFVREMPSQGFVGANVTIPHKKAALRLATLPPRRHSRSEPQTRLASKKGRSKPTTPTPPA